MKATWVVALTLFGFLAPRALRAEEMLPLPEDLEAESPALMVAKTSEVTRVSSNPTLTDSVGNEFAQVRDEQPAAWSVSGPARYQVDVRLNVPAGSTDASAVVVTLAMSNRPVRAFRVAGKASGQKWKRVTEFGPALPVGFLLDVPDGGQSWEVRTKGAGANGIAVRILAVAKGTTGTLSANAPVVSASSSTPTAVAAATPTSTSPTPTPSPARTPVAVATASPVQAGDEEKSPPGPIREPERRGWTAGLAGGFGDLHLFPEKADEVLLENAASVGGSLGVALGPRSLLLLDVSWVNHRGVRSHSLAGVGLQFYATNRIWFRISAGAARYYQKADPVSLTPKVDRWSGGVKAGFGVEWMQFRRLSLGSQLEWVGGSFPDDEKGNLDVFTASLHVLTVQWYGF